MSSWNKRYPLVSVLSLSVFVIKVSTLLFCVCRWMMPSDSSCPGFILSVWSFLDRSSFSTWFWESSAGSSSLTIFKGHIMLIFSHSHMRGFDLTLLKQCSRGTVERLRLGDSRSRTERQWQQKSQSYRPGLVKLILCFRFILQHV